MIILNDKISFSYNKLQCFISDINVIINFKIFYFYLVMKIVFERKVLMEDNKLIIYKNSEGNIIVDAIYKDETLWLSQKECQRFLNVPQII